MLNETETKETIVFFGTFLSLVAFQLSGVAPPPPPPLVTPMGYTALKRQGCQQKLQVERPLSDV